MKQVSHWKVLDKTVYRHSPFRAIEDVRYEMPNGQHRTYSLKKEGHVCAILAFDESNQIILAKQYRPGPDRILDELPGGGVEKDESPIESAKRELKEETGFESDDWIAIGTPEECAYSTVTRHAFIAKNCKNTANQNLDETEYIEVVFKSIDQFIEQLMKGDCTDPEVAWMGLYHLGIIGKK